MSRKPLIGINGEFRAARKDSIPLTWINTGYYDSVSATGGLPTLIPPLANDADLKQYLEMLDGLVLTGCSLDLDPVRLGMERHPHTRPMPARREDFDRRLCKLAVEMRIPTLAIGLGMQTLNVICGGTLFQHIPEDIPRSLHHRDTVENCLRHIIDIVPGTRMDKIYGPGEIRVNSQHHMSVDQVASPFRVSATAPDGVVEAYESMSDDWFCLGVQWHPENETASALDMQVFEAFLEACQVQEQPAILQMPMRQAA
jgi:putative glutamine amidotransferase